MVQLGGQLLGEFKSVKFGQGHAREHGKIHNHCRGEQFPSPVSQIDTVRLNQGLIS